MRIKDFFGWFLWEGINPVLLNIRSRQKTFDNNFAGLNIGCGLDNPKNWLGIDGGAYVLLKKIPRPFIKIFYRFTNSSRNYSLDSMLGKIYGSHILHCEITRGLPFPDATVPAIFSSHFFEHITKTEAQALVRECYRVMKNGGIIRICVPSLEESVKKIEMNVEQYRAGNIAPIEKFVTYNFSGFQNNYSNHWHMYNFTEMKQLLEEAGFQHIAEYAFGKGNIPNVEQLDTREGLFVEAVKK